MLALALALITSVALPTLSSAQVPSSGDAVQAASVQTSTDSSATVDAAAAAAPPITHTITYDKYSLMIDGKRTFIWSG